MKAFTIAFGCALALPACAGTNESAPDLGQVQQQTPVDFYKGLDDEARLIAAAALQAALETFPSGNAHFWSASSGAGGAITPLRTTREPSGRYCRTFREIVIPPGAPQIERRARACRNSDTATARWNPA